MAHPTLSHIVFPSSPAPAVIEQVHTPAAQIRRDDVAVVPGYSRYQNALRQSESEFVNLAVSAMRDYSEQTARTRSAPTWLRS